MDQTEPSLLRRLVRIITFLDLPINRKFTVFAIGVLFWLLSLAAVAVFALVTINHKYDLIVHQIIPHERVTQKIARNLGAVAVEAEGINATGDPQEIRRHAQLAFTDLEAIRSLASSLALGGKVTDTTYCRPDDPGAECFETTSVSGSPEGVAFLRDLGTQLEAIDKSLHALAKSKVEEPGQSAIISGGLKEELATATALTSAYTASTSALYRQNQEEIRSTIRLALLTMAAVLLLAVILLGVFTRWIADAIARPIRTVIGQIHAVATGEIDLSQKITISSQDEIGTLSNEFNRLMESVYGMSTFKSVIEEDSTTADIYARLGAIFEKVAEIGDYCIYEIKDNRHEMLAAYPPGLPDDELRCSGDILANCSLCRARKTGHVISSITFPGVCNQFRPNFPDQQHVCVPVNIGGRTGIVVQFLFRPSEGKLDNHLVQERIFKAESYLKQSQSVLEAKRLLATLRESSLKDPLTGLYNRRFLQDHSQQLIAGAKRREKNIGMLMCDLDYFKQVNDKYGHETGDQLLRETATVISRSVRESDYVIRFGGEEFIVLLLDIDDDSALKVAEKIRKAVAETKVRTTEGPLSKTISIGVSVFPADTEAFWQAIKYADVALYRAKEAGRNRVVRFTNDMWAGDAF